MERGRDFEREEDGGIGVAYAPPELIILGTVRDLTEGRLTQGGADGVMFTKHPIGPIVASSARR